MDKRYLENPFKDYDENVRFVVPKEQVKDLICTYVDAILENTRQGTPGARHETRGDLYVGNAGIAYMFWKLSESNLTKDLYPALEHAESYIKHAKSNALNYKKKADERIAFLCGNSGIYAMSAVISASLGNKETLADDLKNFLTGYEPSLQIAYSRHGCDEVLVGRAGYLSGCYWLNDIIKPAPIDESILNQITRVVVDSGREYAKQTNSVSPLMYQYHGTEYLGAAHGLCSILHNIMDSPSFKPTRIEQMSQTILTDVQSSIDFYLSLQDSNGNFPVAMEDLISGREKRLVHWCHGAPGSVYLFVKAYLIFNDRKYLLAAKKCGELVWQQGLLRKGPGICHGVAGNAYVFLVLYRLTNETKYLYRANQFMLFLTDSNFKLRARVPDRPYSLYEGVAGTVCFLIDLLEPEKASFPFMEVFH